MDSDGEHAHLQCGLKVHLKKCTNFREMSALRTHSTTDIQLLGDFVPPDPLPGIVPGPTSSS